MPPSQTYYHLKAVDYPVAFPDALDPVPVLLDKHTYFDDWMMNRICVMIQTVQQFCIDNVVDP